VEYCLGGEISYNEKYGFSIPESFVSVQAEEIYRSAEELREVQANHKKSLK
jgi:hypothetical protein